MISSSSMTRMEALRRMSVLLGCGAARARAARAGAGGKFEDEPGALADHALAVDRAVVLAHDAVGDREAEAGALADRLGGEERVVDPREVFARECPSRCRPVPPPALPSFMRRGRPTASRPSASRPCAFRNRLRNTCCSLCSSPSTITGSAASSRRTLMCCSSNWCSSSDSTSLMTALRSTGATSVPPRRGRPREVQQAVDDLRGPERLAFDLLEQPRARILGIGALQQHLREARDAGQRRVHLVRDAGGEQADRRHLLGDLQLLLELRRGA